MDKTTKKEAARNTLKALIMSSYGDELANPSEEFIEEFLDEVEYNYIPAIYDDFLTKVPIRAVTRTEQ